MSSDIKLDSPKERNIFFYKDIIPETSQDLIKTITEINESDRYLSKSYMVYDLEYKPKPIKIYIDSNGGSVVSGFSIVSAIENSKTEIHTIVTGEACSMAFIMSICGHKRFAYKYSRLLYHSCWSGSFGTAKEMKEDVQQLESLQKTIDKITLQKTMMKRKLLDKIHNEKTQYIMTAEQALELGCIDEII